MPILISSGSSMDRTPSPQEPPPSRINTKSPSRNAAPRGARTTLCRSLSTGQQAQEIYMGSGLDQGNPSLFPTTLSNPFDKENRSTFPPGGSAAEGHAGPPANNSRGDSRRSGHRRTPTSGPPRRRAPAGHHLARAHAQGSSTPASAGSPDSAWSRAPTSYPPRPPRSHQHTGMASCPPALAYLGPTLPRSSYTRVRTEVGPGYAIAGARRLQGALKCTHHWRLNGAEP